MKMVPIPMSKKKIVPMKLNIKIRKNTLAFKKNNIILVRQVWATKAVNSFNSLSMLHLPSEELNSRTSGISQSLQKVLPKP
jgi:hypothetical protein